jgi:hypothetical protein
MIKSVVTAALLFLSLQGFSQAVMEAKGIKPDNVCNTDVYFLIENKAKPIEVKAAIQERANTAISFAKDNPAFTGNASIQLAVNCKGEVGGGFHVVKSSGNESLDNQLIEFLKTIKEYKPGRKNNNKPIDSWYMWHVDISNGLITLN